MAGAKKLRMEETPHKQIDITKHVLMPPFRLLNNEEVNEVLAKFNISILQLPQISVKDPMAKSVKAKINDVLEIEHDNPTGGKDLFYRRVIE